MILFCAIAYLSCGAVLSALAYVAGYFPAPSKMALWKSAPLTLAMYGLLAVGWLPVLCFLLWIDWRRLGP